MPKEDQCVKWPDIESNQNMDKPNWETAIGAVSRRIVSIERGQKCHAALNNLSKLPSRQYKLAEIVGREKV